MNQRPEYDVKKTGQNLRRYRLACGYTAEQVREYICVGTVQAVYKWERGASFPSLSDFFALAELYGVRPDELLVRREEAMACLEREPAWVPRHVESYLVLLGKLIHK